MTHAPENHRRNKASNGFEHASAPDLSALDESASDELAIPPSLHHLADERIVHGLLRTLSTPSRMALDRSVVDAVAMLPADRSARPRGRRAPDARPMRRTRSWLRSLARFAPALGLVLVTIVLAQLANQTTPTADAAFDRVVKAATKAGPRRYSLRIEHATDGPGAPMQRGIVDIAPGGRFLVRFGHVGRDPSNAFGFDGTNYWLVGPKGPVRVGRSEKLLARRGQLGEVTDLLVVDRLLKRLGTGYHITSEQLHGDAEGDEVVTRFTAVRSAEPARTEADGLADTRRTPRWRGRGPGPTEVVFEVRGTDRVVTRLDATWPTQSPQRGAGHRIAKLHFNLMGDQVPPPERGWFAHRMHHAADRLVEHDGDSSAALP